MASRSTVVPGTDGKNHGTQPGGIVTDSIMAAFEVVIPDAAEMVRHRISSDE